MDCKGMNFDAEHHEQGALLHGYLFGEVYKFLLTLLQKDAFDE